MNACFRMSSRILGLASVFAATGYGIACSSSSDSQFSTPDAGGDSQPSSTCPPMVTPPAPVTVSAEAECVLYEDGGAPGDQCATPCPSSYFCEGDYDYGPLFAAANLTSGTYDDDGGVIPYTCPADAGPITFTCTYVCKGGRSTEGFDVPLVDAATDSGTRLASMAHLEAVSVHAFARLGHELAAHGADVSLLKRVNRAQKDEARHARVVARLARSRGAVVSLPRAPGRSKVRSLVDIAIENAVEGCVRETYGALVGAIERTSSAEASVRAAMSAVTDDECRHADLAWTIHAWIIERLDGAECARVERAMMAAIAELRTHDRDVVDRLFRGILQAA